jgi:outer membrane biosynthesis protein TonB
MRATRWRVTLGVLAFFTAVPALAQENIDAGKTPAELYAADCAICHKTPEGLSKAGGLWGLQNFLREHYTASKESAAAIAAYLAALDSKGSPREHTRTTRRARKGEKAKAEKAKAKEEKSKKTDEAKAPPVKPAEAKAKADTKPKVKSEAKTEAKSEAKPEKKPEAKPESKPAEAKAAPKDDAKAKPVEAKAEPKTNGAKAPDAKPEKKSD